MPLPLTVSCFIKIQIGFTFLVPAHLGSPRKGPLNGCVCVCVCFGAETAGHQLSFGVYSVPVECTHTHTHPFNGPFTGTTRVGRYQKGKTNLDFTEARQ